jgi:putative intracellular protease/amidase
VTPARVLVPIPARDFDPTEVAVSWKVLTGLGHTVAFASPDGRPGAADDIMVTGRGLDPWSPIPLLGRLKAIGLVLRANADARVAYAEMIQDPAFRAPMTWDEAGVDGFDGLLLPGGHRRRGMRAYLESGTLQHLVVQAFKAGKPVAAICHGVLLAARSIDPATGRSVLFGRKTTALTWKQERTASTLAHVGRFWDPDYYRTYVEAPGEPAGYMSVEMEVRRALAADTDFLDVAADDPAFSLKTSGLARDRPGDDRPAFVVRDGSYASARWPGDAHTFARVFAEVLEAQAA